MTTAPFGLDESFKWSQDRGERRGLSADDGRMYPAIIGPTDDSRLGRLTDVPFIATYTHMAPRLLFSLPPTFTLTGHYLLSVYTPSFPRLPLHQRAAVMLPGLSLM